MSEFRRLARRPDRRPARGRHARRRPAAHPRRRRVAARRASSPAASPSCCRRACGRATSWRSRSPTRPPARCGSRVEALVPGNRVWISTFHSLGARLLRQYADRLGLDRNFTIYDIDDRNKLVKDALDAAGIDNVRFTPERIAGAISKAKNQLLTPEQYAQDRDRLLHADRREGLPGYEKRLRQANALDFDDLLYLPALALKHDEELRAELDARFRYVLIDEYQDTNQAQYEIASACRRTTRTCASSATRTNRSTSGAARTSATSSTSSATSRTRASSRSSKNYRSTKAILHAASTLIAHNKQRKKKSLVTENDAGRAGPRPHVRQRARRGRGRSSLRIKEAVKAGKCQYRDFADLPAHQRPDAVARKRVRQARRAVPDRQGPGVLRAQGKQRRARLPAAARQSARRSASCGSSTSRPAASARCRSTSSRPSRPTARSSLLEAAGASRRAFPRSRARPRRAARLPQD